MKSKTILILLLSTLLLGVCALCGLTTLGTVQWLRTSPVRAQIFPQQQLSAQVSESYTYDVPESLTVEVDTSFGDITIKAGDTEQVLLEVVKTGWAASQDEALAAAEALVWEVEQDGNHLALIYDASTQKNATLPNGGSHRSASFYLTVPVDTEVKLRSGSGRLILEGTTGSAELNASFGEISVRDLSGSLLVQSNTGRVSINNIQAGQGEINISNTFGDLEAQDLAGSAILLDNSSGSLTASGLEATGELTFRGEFTAIQIEDFEAASLSLNNSTGEVKVSRGLLRSALEASTSFGSLNISEVKAKGYTMNTQTGSITLDEAEGELNLTSTFGDITVSRALDAILNLDASTGAAYFSGSLDPSKDHTVSTSFGDITLVIPEDSAFNLELDATFGTINSEIPVTQSGSLSSGEADNSGRAGKSHLTAAMNGGGPSINARAENGNIQIKINTELK